MKKIYILTAVLALLTLSLNAQLKATKNGDVIYPKAPTEKVVTPPDGYFRTGPSRASDITETPPYSNGFSSTEWDWWQVINANNDSYTWTYNSAGYASIRYNSSYAADDWLVTAPIYLQAGRTYKFYIDAWVGLARYPEKMEVKLASGNDATALSNGTTIIGSTTLTNTSATTLSNENVTVNTTGDYYFGIHCTSDADMYYLYVDNLVIDVEAAPEHDLAIALSAPAQAGTGNTVTVTATVTNTGGFAESGYTVTFTAGGTTISTQTGGTLGIGETATFTAEYPTGDNAGTVNFGATVACTGDAVASNNNATASTQVINLPAPENVAATASGQSGTMTWDAPSNLPMGPGWVTEGFEDTSMFPEFSLGGITASQHSGAIGDWTLYDSTGSSVYGYQNITVPNLGDPMAWMVFAPGSSQLSQTLTDTQAAHDGDQMMASFCPASSTTASDHWLISPELSGNAQEITFYARELTDQYGAETFEVLYSTTDNNPASFTLVESFSSTSTDWAQFSAQLPAGAKYFAIRHTSTDIFALFVDDVHYQTMVPLPPVSYNVYLDGQLVGNVDANTFSYTFNNVASGEHQCAVSAVYDLGESAAVPTTFSTLPKTDAPTISVTEGATSYTITATATDPTAAVTLVVDGVTYTGTGSVSTTIERGTDDQTVAVSATAQEQGKLVSDPATQDVTVPALPITPTPTITYEQTAATVVITATGEGIITLTAGGQTVTGEGPISITIMRSIEDQTVSATATAVATNHQPSASANASVPVPALSGGPAEALEGLLRMHLLVVDQFKENIPDDNSHPEHYGYVLKYEPNGPNGTGVKESGTVQVDIKKTEANVNGYYTLSDIQSDIDRHLTLDVLTADVGMFLPGEDPDVLYYQMQSKKDANPELGHDYITQLQYMKNIQKYEEMLATSPNKTHRYNANETYHYFDDSTPIVTGTYGQNFMTYAPSVSTWGIQRRYFETDGLDNTYGAPIWKTGVGQVRVIHTEAQLQRGPQGSTQWDGVGGPCSLVFLGVEAFGDLPSAEVSNILYEPYMFRVWVQSPGNNLRGCSLIGKNVDPDKPGEHWEGDGTSYGSVPVLVYEGLTSDGILYKHVQSTEEGNNVDWGEKIQFGALDSGISDLVVYVRFYYRSTGRGINNSNRLMLRGEGDDEDDDTPEVPGYYATEGDADPQITTGIMGVYTDLSKPVESVTYVNAQGMQSSKPFDGVNIVITRYTDGTTSTRKVVR